MEDPSFQIIDANDKNADAITALLNQRNDDVGVQWDPKPITIVIRNAEGKTVGGLSGSTNFGWLHIRLLVVDSTLGGMGYGSRLVRLAEEEAVSRGCTFAHLDTFSFQALPFYDKLGYEVFGTLDDYPTGHQRYYLKKRLIHQI
jgi:ribosomal protein S18 acetylase RimI-like enzyme